ncbi:MAG: beta-lactamase class A [Rhodothermales bacterium]|jgi:beta-lactamase class A
MKASILLVCMATLASIQGCNSQVDTSALQAQINEIVATQPDAIVAVSVRDGASGVNFDRNGDRLFHAASTMKVPVMMEVFRRASRGDFSLGDSLVLRNQFRSIVDGSLYAIGDDSDDAIYLKLGSKMEIRQLVENMIVVSSNLATNILIDLVSADSVQATSERIGTTKMRTLRGVEDLKAFELGLSNRTTSADLAVLMSALAEGRAVGPSEDAAMIEVLARQQFGEMIPAGLPPDTRVAHKTGQITEIHHDAAIIFPDRGAPFTLVILVEGIPDDAISSSIGSRITRAVYEFVRPASP